MISNEKAMELITNALQADESKYTAELDEALAVAQKALSENKKYAVVSYWCGESGDTNVWLYDSEDEAVEAKNWLWKKSYDFATEDEDFDPERSSNDKYEARVAWKDELYRMFEVQVVSEKEEI